MFSVEISKEAQDDLKSLDKKTVEIIVRKIWSIRENPLHYLERLRGLTFWKLRVGDYRVIIHIASKEQKLIVLKIGHRKNIYKQL